MQTSEDAKKALAKLFLVFPSPGTAGEINHQARMTAYWEILSRLAPSFVIEACEYAARGKCGDGRFLPSAGELYQVGQEFAVRAAQAKREAAPRLSDAPTQNDYATRQRIIAGFKKLSEDLRNGTPIDPDRATMEVFHPSDPFSWFPGTAPPQKFDPVAETFSPYRLKMTIDEIKACVMAYRAGGDWQSMLPPSQGGPVRADHDPSGHPPPMDPDAPLQPLSERIFEETVE